jgi:hypothetical protein
MRWVRLSLATFALLTPGCASSEKRLSVLPPTPEELPDIPTRHESHVQASIAAERDPDQPRFILVPDFREPPLTPEEKAATGKLDPPYRLLPYALRRRAPGQAVGDWGGADVAVSSVYPSIAIGPAERVAFAGDYGGASIGVDQFITRIFAGFPAEHSGHAGPAEYPDVSIGDRGEPARAMRRHGQ